MFLNSVPVHIQINIKDREREEVWRIESVDALATLFCCSITPQYHIVEVNDNLRDLE